MKSIKILFAISSIRYIKPLIHLVVLTLNRFVLVKNIKTTMQNILANVIMQKRKEKTSIFWVCPKNMKTYPSA
jgi:hypothetical protein